VSQTSFSPESPADRTTRLLGEALCAEVRLHSTKWPLAARKVAIDCIKWLGDEVESENCRRANNGVRFVHLNEKQSDTLHALYYEVTFEEAFEVTFD
jgi:hypothetical protein